MLVVGWGDAGSRFLSCACRWLQIRRELVACLCKTSVSTTLAWLSQLAVCWRRSRDLPHLVGSTLSHSTALDVRDLGLSGEHL